MRLKTTFLALVLVAGCLWAQEKRDSAPPADSGVPRRPRRLIRARFRPRIRRERIPCNSLRFRWDRGKKIYTTQCALCHGEKGDGKGELASDMKLALPDFTKPDTLKSRTDGELFAIIGGWKDPMPSQAGRLTDTHRWNLVNYLRAVSGNVPAKATGNEPEENIILVPAK